VGRSEKAKLKMRRDLWAFSNHHYECLPEGSLRSAREILPLVLRLVEPKNVVDIGCGTGTWLSVCLEFGVQDILGIDGEWVNKKLLVIPEESFLTCDLKKPLILERNFDLVLSLEVAEHLPEEYAVTFIHSLTKIGPVVLFSAAIPFQCGFNHLNEQWQDYWAKLFHKQGFLPVDCIRKHIWKNDKVEFWYSQNSIIYAEKNYLHGNIALHEEYRKTNANMLSLVHPRKYLEVTDPKNLSLRNVLPALPYLLINAIKRRLSQK
jgi:SAM-dependent methyltransferase